jgi:hypothetical protein
MQRRDISTAILASVTGAALLPRTTQAQTCTPPCFAQTPGETSAGVTPTNTADIPGNHPSGDVARYGCVMDGSTNDTANFQNACKVGGEIVISGPLALASGSLAALPDGGITLKSNTTIRCVNGGRIVVTGTTACNVFVSTNASNIKFIDVDCTGNSAGTESIGYFWWCKGTSAAAGPMVNLRFVRGSLTNFAAFYWIYFDNSLGTTYPMRDIRVTDASFTSLPGNAQGPTNIIVPAAMIGFSGSDTIRTLETVRDCHVENCTADGTYIKSFVAIWSGTFRIRVSGNILRNFGTDTSFANDVGVYAMLAYDHSHGTGLRPDLIEFSNNIVDSVRSCGIYIAGANRISILNNQINGQTDTVDGTLPKGGIAINASQVVTVRGNTLDLCYYGIQCYLEPGSTTNDRAVIQDNVISNVAASGTGVKVGGTTGGNAPSIEIDGLAIDSANASVTGILIVGTSAVGIDNLAIRNFRINTKNHGIRVYNPDASAPAFGNVHLGNGDIQSFNSYGILFNNCSNTLTRLTIDSIVFSMPDPGAVMLYVAGSTGLTVRNVTFCDMTTGTGAGWYGSNAKGRLEGVRYVNVAVGNRYLTAGNDLGVSAPAGWGADNDFVQNLDVSELGTAGGKYVRLGWTFDRSAGAWKECRALTGN